MNAAMVCFLIGVALGAWGGFAGRDAWKVAKAEEKKREDDELLREIKELRAWKADHIGIEK